MPIEEENNSIACIGALNVDRTMRCVETVRLGESNTVNVTERFGGVMHNVAATMHYLGYQVSFAALVGMDTNGDKAHEYLSRIGLNCSYLLKVPNEKTGTYTLILNNCGEVIIGVTDMSIYDRINENQVTKLTQSLSAKTWVIDSNFDRRALERIIELANGRCLMAVAVSSVKAPRLIPALEHLNSLFVNEAELMSIKPDAGSKKEAIEKILESGTKQVFVTQGHNGSIVANHEIYLELPTIPVKIRDLNGVGDAFSGAVIASLLKNDSPQKAMVKGLAAASLIAEVDGATRSDITIEMIKRRTMNQKT